LLALVTFKLIDNNKVFRQEEVRLPLEAVGYRLSTLYTTFTPDAIVVEVRKAA